jgi:hypothetical protein
MMTTGRDLSSDTHHISPRVIGVESIKLQAPDRFPNSLLLKTALISWLMVLGSYRSRYSRTASAESRLCGFLSFLATSSAPLISGRTLTGQRRPVCAPMASSRRRRTLGGLYRRATAAHFLAQGLR